MATGLPWPGELDALKKGVSRLIGINMKEYEEAEEPLDEQLGVQPAAI
jgi:hypothetical protein